MFFSLKAARWEVGELVFCSLRGRGDARLLPGYVTAANTKADLLVRLSNLQDVERTRLVCGEDAAATNLYSGPRNCGTSHFSF